MLHRIIHEQGNRLDIRDDISEKIACFPINI